MDKKIIIANWRKKEEGLGGQESFYDILSKILETKIISYQSVDKVLKYFSQTDSFMRGYTIGHYLKWYEDLFDLDLIIKNSGIGGLIELKTPQIVIFQDPYYSILAKMVNKGVFSGCEFYLGQIDMQRRTAEQGTTVAVSNFMKRDMELNDIKCDRVIEEGIDTEIFRPVTDKEEIKKSHNLPLDKKIGITVTKFLHQKGWDILAELINKFPDIHWIVILTEPIGSKPKLKNVTFVECVLPEVMPHIYNCADFYLSTSPVESFGLSSCEAAACDLPVITYKTGWAWDWFDSKIGIRVDNWTTEDFAKAVKKIRDSDLKEFSPRETLIKKGLTKEVMEKNWKEFIENLLKK